LSIGVFLVGTLPGGGEFQGWWLVVPMD